MWKLFIHVKDNQDAQNLSFSLSFLRAITLFWFDQSINLCGSSPSCPVCNRDSSSYTASTINNHQQSLLSQSYFYIFTYLFKKLNEIRNQLSGIQLQIGNLFICGFLFATFLSIEQILSSLCMRQGVRVSLSFIKLEFHPVEENYRQVHTEPPNISV